MAEGKISQASFKNGNTLTSVGAVSDISISTYRFARVTRRENCRVVKSYSVLDLLIAR